MKWLLVASASLCMLVSQAVTTCAQVLEPKYAAFDRLALPDSILPPGYSALPGRAWPKNMANPLVTTDPEVIGFISIWLTMSKYDEEAMENDGSAEAEEEIEKFTTALSSYVRAAYLAMYLPPPGEGSDEIGVMALLLRPECDMLDDMNEGIMWEGMMFVNADTLALYAFTDNSDADLRKSMLSYFKSQMKE